MKYYKEEEVATKKQVLKKITCDVCNKEITRYFYKLTTGHYDWGNDSRDSIEHEDICGNECLSVRFLQYLNKDSDTAYFKVVKDRR